MIAASRDSAPATGSRFYCLLSRAVRQRRTNKDVGRAAWKPGISAFRCWRLIFAASEFARSDSGLPTVLCFPGSIKATLNGARLDSCKRREEKAREGAVSMLAERGSAFLSSKNVPGSLDSGSKTEACKLFLSSAIQVYSLTSHKKCGTGHPMPVKSRARHPRKALTDKFIRGNLSPGRYADSNGL